MVHPGCSIEELTVSIAVEIVLDVSVIGMVEDIEGSESNPRMHLFDGQGDVAPELDVGRKEAWKSQLVSRPDKLAVLIGR